MKFNLCARYSKGRSIHLHPLRRNGMTGTMERMHAAQFAGSSLVPAHAAMMGFIGMGNNPMVGASVALAVAVEHSLNR